MGTFNKLWDFPLKEVSGQVCLRNSMYYSRIVTACDLVKGSEKFLSKGNRSVWFGLSWGLPRVRLESTVGIVEINIPRARM